MEQEFREIQLGRKQIVFLFMALVVFSVAVFLLGISVGRGVREAGVQPPTAGTDVAVAAPAPAEMPPPTVTTPADLTYHDQLQGQTPAAPAGSAAPPPAPVEPPTPVAEAPASTAPVVAATSTRTTPAASPTRGETAAAPKPAASSAAAKETAPAAGASTTSGWHLQLYALRSRESANTQVATLKSKGYTASVVPSPGGLFKVVVGPFAQRSDAERVSERLEREEGLKPLIQR